MTGFNEINKALAEILGLPGNTQSAVLLMRAGHIPVMRVTTILLDDGGVRRATERFTLQKKESK